MAEGSPTVRRRELGMLLRELRKNKDLTVEQAAAHLECSASKISRIETGQRGASPRDVRDLCDLYGMSGAERDRLMSLAREGRQQGWWRSYDLPDAYRTYIGLEAAAVTIKAFQSSIIPGLLQTVEYSRAIHEAGVPENPTTDLSPELINQRVEARIRRQKLLTQARPLEFSVVMDEAVLHRVVGGPEVMRDQLQRVLDLATLVNVSIQIIPYEVGAHPALESTFSIMDFRDPVSSVVYVEGLVGWIYLERSEDIDRFRRVYQRLHSIALGPRDSLKMVAEALKTHTDQVGALG